MIKLIDLISERNISAKEEKIVKALKKTGKFKKNDPAMYAIAASKAEGLDPVDKTDKYLSNRRKTIAKNIDETHLNWPPTPDHEATMAMGELRSMIKNSITIYKNINPNQQLPGWVSGYVTLASDYMNSVAQYLIEEEATLGQKTNNE